MVSAGELAVKGKVVLITGVTSGLGRDIARTFTTFGAHVVGTGRRHELGRAVAEELGAFGDFTFQEGDVVDESSSERIVASTIERHGRLDILINNAGFEGTMVDAHRMSTPEWSAVIDTNLTGTFLCSRAVLPAMRSQQRGCIINISSSLAVEGAAWLAAYTASKAGVGQLTRSMAVEYLADGIRVNSVLIAGVDSEARRRTGDGYRRQSTAARPPSTVDGRHESQVDLRSLLPQKGDDIARAIALLCADDAAPITGATIAMDRAISAGLLTSIALARLADGTWV